MYFLLLCGSHQGDTPKREPGKDQERAANFTAGDIVPSEKDLEALFGLNKFKKLSDRKGKRLFEQQQKEHEEKLRLAEAKEMAEREAKFAKSAEKDKRKPANPLFSSR